jgi:type I restriction-modification system DNA methylase subunit
MNYKEVIESRYNRQNWQLLLHDIFGNKIKFWNTPSTIPTSSQFAKQALWLGTITLSDNQTISIYEVELSDSVDIERNRRGIRDMLLTDWRNNGNAGAIMFCYRKNESVLRFSYVSEAWTFTDDGSYQKESTDAKRFTYLLGEGHRSRTAIQQFEKLRDSSLTLKDLTKAFSVDAVSDMFFDGYKKQYEDIIQYITGKRMVKVANKWEEQIKNDPCEEIMQEFAHFPNPEKAVRDYVKKLMGRLVFLQFLQKKGWLGVPAGAEWGTGDAEFIQNLFAQTADKEHFIDNVLEALFNDLNSENEKKLPQYRTPYLNGGLFERDATDETEFPLPAKYMQSLLDFFASYNFTIDENDPDDAEVGVDPEMLGRIFENLLEDNKDKGAFYTPKEIVSYMCRESLIAYLQTDIEDEPTKEAIRQFVTTHDVNALGTNNKFRQQVDEALCNVKICDPAIGSGAFPMGLLKELFQCRTALEGISQHQAAEIKKHIIQQNIYGVDIERGAVDIARLRFWLSLIVDEETPQALPNLDFKIMQGNSLLEQYKGVDLSNITELKQDKVGAYQTTMFDDMIDVLRLDLRKKLDEYYNCTEHKRKAILKQDIINNVKQQLKEQSINVDFGDLDLSGNNQFMLWHTWFYDVFSQGGFDIVIGNPPYVNIANFKDDKVRLLYQKQYKTVRNKSDLYSIFTEQAHYILRERGLCSFIFSNSWLGTDSFYLFRKFLVNGTRVIQLVDLPDKVFDNATVKTCIILFSKESVDLNTIILIDYNGKVFSKMGYSLTYDSIKKFDNYPFSFDRNINLSKVASIKLGDIAGFSLGIKTSNDKKFISNIPFKEDCYHLIRGRNIQRYNTPISDEWIWYRPDLFMEKVGAGPRRIEYFTTSPKILIQDIATEICATIDENKYLCNDTINLIYKLNKGYSFQYILGLLNSKAVRFWHKKVFPEGLHIKIYQLKEIPIPSIKEEEQKPFIMLVNQILAIKRRNISEDTSDLESEIDHLVYNLYGLTEEEIKIIEGCE